jgi:Protein of unknown function (DUF3102)
MIDRARRDIKVIESELHAALKRETADIIAIGELLLEAKEQLEHGSWLPWLSDNFELGISTAQNYMNAARFAIKYPTVGHLKLRPTALYWLGSRMEYLPLDEIEAIFKVAETKWVDVGHAIVIIKLLHAERSGTTEEEQEVAAIEEQQRAIAEARAREEAVRSEVDDILDGPPPGLPPAQEPAAVDFTLQSFEQAIATLAKLHTKPLASFAATKHSPILIGAIAAFLNAIYESWREYKQEHPEAQDPTVALSFGKVREENS